MEGEGANGQAARGAIPRLPDRPDAYGVAGCDENATPVGHFGPVYGVQYVVDVRREGSGRSKLGGQKRSMDYRGAYLGGWECATSGEPDK